MGNEDVRQMTAQQEVENVVNEFMKEKKLFTYCDIASEVIKKNKEFYYSETYKYIKLMFDFGKMPGYDRDLGDAGGCNRIMIYHPVEVDVSTYPKYTWSVNV